jgi:hypothetical protein
MLGFGEHWDFGPPLKLIPLPRISKVYKKRVLKYRNVIQCTGLIPPPEKPAILIILY